MARADDGRVSTHDRVWSAIRAMARKRGPSRTAALWELQRRHQRWDETIGLWRAVWDCEAMLWAIERNNGFYADERGVYERRHPRPGPAAPTGRTTFTVATWAPGGEA